MKLDEYLDLVAESAPSEWRSTVAPTFMFRVVPVRSSGGGTADFELQEHNTSLTYAKDIRIGMAWGLVSDKRYMSDWLERLPNKAAQAVILDFMFGGSVVFRDTLIAVDNWRCILPEPLNIDEAPYKVPMRRLKIAKLMHQLVGPDTSFESYMKRIGIAPIDRPWP